MSAVHAWIDERFFVVGFAWMSKKDEPTYQRVFNEIFRLPQSSYNVEAYISDFEIAPCNAIQSIFPAALSIKCIFHLSQAIQRWTRGHGPCHFYQNEELKEWIVLFSKLAYLPEDDVFLSFTALIWEYEGFLMLQIAKERDEQRVTAFLDYVQKTYIYNGRLSNPSPARYALRMWNINKHIILQRPNSNNAVESWNRQYKGHFPGGGKPDRSKLIQYQMDEEKAVRDIISRHQRRPEELFRDVRPRQLLSEQRIYELVSDWNTGRMRSGNNREYEEIVIFLKSIQEELFFAADRNSDTDEFSDEEDENE